jgi:hypothetical protein
MISLRLHIQSDCPQREQGTRSGCSYPDQFIAGPNAEDGEAAGGKLKGLASAAAAAAVPWSHVFGDIEHTSGPIEKNQIERIGHAEGVHGIAGCEQQPIVGLNKRGPAKQAA